MSADLKPLDFDPATLAFGDKPDEWRHYDAKEDLTWRLLQPEDIPQLSRIWSKMDSSLGKQDRPNQYETPVVLTLVAEPGQKEPWEPAGLIVGAVYGEAVVDFTMIGTSRAVARSVRTVYPHIAMHLWARSIRIVRVLVPARMRRHMGRLLPGFVDISDSVASFVHKIRA